MGKRAYITFLTNDPYVLYTVALWHSWKLTNSKYDFYAVTTNTLGKSSLDLFDRLGINHFEVDVSEFDALVSKSKVQKNWIEALKKLAIFKLYDFEHLVFLDCDTYMTQNMDELFDMPTLTCTGRYSCDPSKGITNILSGMLGFEPNEEDYKHIMEVVDNVVNYRYENKQLQPENTNDEHILNESFIGRMHGLHCGYQYMPHVFNRHDISWDQIYLVHSGGPKSKWWTEERFINNVGLKCPLSDYDYNMIYWYFNKLDEVVDLYELPFKITKRTPAVDMTTIPLKLPKEKKERKSPVKSSKKKVEAPNPFKEEELW